MSAAELDPKIQPIDPTGHNPCHCGAKAKWTASLRLEGAQIRPSFQHQDLCKEHAEQFGRRPQVEISAHRPAFRAGLKTRTPLSIELGGRVLLTPKRVLL